MFEDSYKFTGKSFEKILSDFAILIEYRFLHFNEIVYRLFVRLDRQMWPRQLAFKKVDKKIEKRL